MLSNKEGIIFNPDTSKHEILENLVTETRRAAETRVESSFESRSCPNLFPQTAGNAASGRRLQHQHRYVRFFIAFEEGTVGHAIQELVSAVLPALRKYRRLNSQASYVQ